MHFNKSNIHIPSQSRDHSLKDFLSRFPKERMHRTTDRYFTSWYNYLFPSTNNYKKFQPSGNPIIKGQLQWRILKRTKGSHLHVSWNHPVLLRGSNLIQSPPCLLLNCLGLPILKYVQSFYKQKATINISTYGQYYIILQCIESLWKKSPTSV